MTFHTIATAGTVPGRMGERADACRRRANDCELAASRVKDQEVCSVYLGMAARWRRMAAQQEAIDRGADRNCPLPTRSAPLIQERLVARRVHPRTVRRRVSRCVQSVRFGPQACFGRIRAWGTLIGSGRTCGTRGRRRHLSSEEPPQVLYERARQKARQCSKLWL
jgi:hypothetical protein